MMIGEDDLLKVAQLYPIIDNAKMHDHRCVKIDRTLWEEIKPIAREMCGEYWQEMFAPWRAFMFDGIWMERG